MAQLITKRDGPIGTLVFSNPRRMNAMTYEMWVGVPPSLAALDADPEVRVIVVAGEGEAAFISGADISEFAELRGTPAQSMRYSAAVEAAFLAPARCSKPVIACIRGYCFGGGLAFAAGCDIRIASHNASFRMPAARLGTGYPPSSIRRFIEIIGATNTMDIFLSARRFNAADAARMGFVSQVHALNDVEQAVTTYAGLIADNAPLTVVASKFAVRQILSDPQDRNMAAVARMVEACFSSDDHREGRDALIQKRSPQFTGK